MIQEVQRLLDQYVAWLKDATTLRQVAGDWVKITTPHLDRHNDFLQIYVRKSNGSYLLSDDGHTIADLEQCGCRLDTRKRQELLRTTLAGFGVQNNSGALEVKTNDGNFSLRKHNLVQAMLSVNDLFYLASPVVASLFYEDVVQWLDTHEVRYTPNVKFTGKSGYDHLFDFVIPKSRVQPERVLETITRPSKEQAETVAFKWLDTKDARKQDSRAYTLLNDNEQQVPQGVIDALRNYDLHPVLWSDRESVRQELAA